MVKKKKKEGKLSKNTHLTAGNSKKNIKKIFEFSLYVHNGDPRKWQMRDWFEMLHFLKHFM